MYQKGDDQIDKEFLKFEKELFDAGYVLDRVRGSHHVYKKGNHTISVNHHPNKMVLRRLRKELYEYESSYNK